MYVIEFAPPMSGFEGRFNTVRLGGAWSKRVSPGDTVLLMDKPKSRIFGKAVIESVIVGKLSDVAPSHAAHNHNQKALGESGAAERFVAGVIKRYGPHKASETSKVTILTMRMLDEKDDLH